MDNKAEDWGHFEFILDKYLKDHGISRNRLANMANLQKTQLSAYCRNKVQRPDLNVLARICFVMECHISDIMKYVPPKNAKHIHHKKEKPTKKPFQEPNQSKCLKTTDLAREEGLHPNTIRFYEKIGLISPAPRAKNGYRIFNMHHLYQLKVCRCIYGAPWTNRAIRDSAMKVLEHMHQWDIQTSKRYAEEHLKFVEREYSKALETVVILKQWAENRIESENERFYNRKEAAELIGVTAEILRNWERNGLIAVPRTGANNARLYGAKEIARLRVIYMLRQTNYSISAIHRSLLLHDSGNTPGAVLLLNLPQPDEEIEYTRAGDHWLESLVTTAEFARKIITILEGINF